MHSRPLLGLLVLLGCQPINEATIKVDGRDTSVPCNEGAFDVPYDGVDADCDGSDDFDADGDGFTSASHEGDDCNDADPDTNPDADDEEGDGIDQNCDGADGINSGDDDDDDDDDSTGDDDDDDDDSDTDQPLGDDPRTCGFDVDVQMCVSSLGSVDCAGETPFGTCSPTPSACSTHASEDAWATTGNDVGTVYYFDQQLAAVSFFLAGEGSGCRALVFDDELSGVAEESPLTSCSQAIAPIEAFIDGGGAPIEGILVTHAQQSTCWLGDVIGTPF